MKSKLLLTDDCAIDLTNEIGVGAGLVLKDHVDRGALEILYDTVLLSI